MRRFGIAGLLVGLLLLGGVGITAYQMGLSAGAASAAVDAGATVVYGVPWGFGGFPFLGVVFGFLFLVFVIGAVGRMASGRRGGPGSGPWSGHGAGPWGHGGPGGWMGRGDGSVPPPVDEMLGRWHERAHGRPAGTPPASDRPSTAEPS